MRNFRIRIAKFDYFVSINTHFENKYDALMEERNKANEEWMAERRRVNQVKMMRGGCPVYENELCRGVLYRSMLSMLRE